LNIGPKVFANYSISRFVIGIVVVLLIIWAASPVTVRVVASTDGNSSTFLLSDSYKIVLHPIPTNDSSPWAITVDPHGVVWFLEESANKLGAYDPASGVFSEYPIPTQGSTPTSLTSDSKGDIWLTELNPNKLAELASGSSDIVEYPVPGLPVSLAGTSQVLGCGPGAVAADPSGSIWIACLFSNQIDEFFPSNHTFASFNLPVFPSAPAGITLDGRGNLWFTAADADMLGKAVIAQLKNGTSDGITEFAPINQTYVFEFSQQTSFLGGTTETKSSLPTPSGIAMDSDGRLWVTEHIDSSFDSYDPSSGSLVRYWTSQTHGDYGFKVTFPNGIAVARNGTIWIAEHYGNRVAEFNPSMGQLTEYPASNSSYEAVYQLALDGSGDPWFVEIQGNAIGELVPTNDSAPISVTLPTSATEPGSGGSLTIPITFSDPHTASNPTSLSLDTSGISGTGILQNMTADYVPSTLSVGPGEEATSSLTLATKDLSPGVYYLTLTVNASPQGILYSVILRLTVTGNSWYWLIPAFLTGAGVVALVSLVLWRRRLRRPSSPLT